ncbi:MAG TPA: (Fe-S)-binding protein [Polyangiaceae bacterium]|nr:(Fe-S)-binding protein [Polyangiaceae bacterium]
MALLIASLVGLFAWTARQRLALIGTGAPVEGGSRVDRLGERLARTWRLAIVQTRMRDYFWAGVAHQFIFLGFGVLLLRTLILWGRGFSPDFNLFVLGPDGFLGLPLGAAYNFLKDIFALLVLGGALVFVYYRTLHKQRRMTLSGEGLLILGIIITMMLADIFYDGASLVLDHHYANNCGEWCDSIATIVAPLGDTPDELTWHATEPAGTLASVILSGLGPGALVIIAHIGFWLHSSLVLIFLNLLPHSKHFHVITAIPNTFLSDLEPIGRLPKVAESTEALMAKVEKAMEDESGKAPAVGFSRVEHFTWKHFLDFYTCTECGRCSDQCPATQTGKLLSPKHLTLDLRNNLYARGAELTHSKQVAAAGTQADAEKPQNDQGELAEEGAGDPTNTSGTREATKEVALVDLVPGVIKPEVLWACTTCRACEERCPVSISYVDKIVQMRRHLVVMKGEFPQELNKPFEGMETNGNPWNLSRQDRTTWADGLNVPMASEKPDAEVLYWVGCAASYDQRAKKIARATAKLLKRAGVDFAILGDEETCTGDPARRAGNEYLFSMLAETNVATLNGYMEKGKKKILTTCPHCFNTLLNEYPDFGGKYDVVHHTDFLLGLVAEKKLVPQKPVQGKITYHDSCYLGRYNSIYESPRDILRSIPGVEVVEPTYWKKDKGLCCGAGGAQMWMEEQNNNRVNVKRTLQLIDTGAKTVASACPFCMTMLGDGLQAKDREDIRQLDVVELLAESCDTGEESVAAE